MKRRLLTQMRHEWRSNLWLLVELIVVSSVIWSILDHIAPEIIVRQRPMGLEIDNVFQVQIGYNSENHPMYKKVSRRDHTVSEQMADALHVMRVLEQMPEVEAVTSSDYAAPYNASYTCSSWNFTDTTMQFPTASYPVLWNVMPNYFKVFRTKGIRGETPEHLERLLARGECLVTRDLVEFEPDGTTDPRILYNRGLRYLNDYNIGAVLPAIRTFDHDITDQARVIVSRRGEDRYRPYCQSGRTYLYLRVRPGTDETEFIAKVRGLNTSLRAAGNSYIRGIRPMWLTRAGQLRVANFKLRNMLIAMGALLVTVFLGVLGTFWFRTQERVRELSIRKVNGATESAVLRRLFSEGIALVVLATPFAIGFDWLLIHSGYSYTVEIWPWKLFPLAAIYAGITVLMVVIMVVLAIWFPARRAMHVDPATTLRSE